jgi:hypothetical protein
MDGEQVIAVEIVNVTRQASVGGDHTDVDEKGQRLQRRWVRDSGAPGQFAAACNKTLRQSVECSQHPHMTAVQKEVIERCVEAHG